MDSVLSRDSIVVASRDQVSCDLGGETAILSFKNGVYYGVDSIGTHVWNLIQRPCSVADIRETLLNEYEVDAERCEFDLLALLEKFLVEGLIEVDPPRKK